MTNEEIERNIRFVIEQQAQFLVNFQKIGDEMQEVKNVLFTIVGVMGKLAETQTKTADHLGKLAEAQTKTDERLGTLAGAQRQTDERLNAFITVLEKHLGGNGRIRGKRRKRPG